MKVAILAATGNTGQSIVNGLLESTTTKFVCHLCQVPKQSASTSSTPFPEVPKIDTCTSKKKEITALTRPSSLEKPSTKALAARGIRVVPVDLEAISAARPPPSAGNIRDLKDRPYPQDADPELVKLLRDIDVVISATYYLNLDDQIPLIDAARVAGVKRFVPCNFQTVAPRGVQLLADAVRCPGRHCISG